MWDQVRGDLQCQPGPYFRTATLAAVIPKVLPQLLSSLYRSFEHLNIPQPMNAMQKPLAGAGQLFRNAASNAQPMDSMRSAFVGTQQFFHNAGSSARDRVAGVEWDQAPKHIQDYITEHPYQTTFYVASGVVVAAPFVVAGPLLGAAGFTAAGPAAGEPR